MWRQQGLESHISAHYRCKIPEVTQDMQTYRANHTKRYRWARQTSKWATQIHECAQNSARFSLAWSFAAKETLRFVGGSGGRPSDLWQAVALTLHKQLLNVLRHLQTHNKPTDPETRHTHTQMQQPPHRIRPKPVPRLEEARQMSGNRITWSSVHVMNASYSEPSDPLQSVKFLCGGAEAGRVGRVCGSWIGLKLGALIGALNGNRCGAKVTVWGFPWVFPVAVFMLQASLEDKNTSHRTEISAWETQESNRI